MVKIPYVVYGPMYAVESKKPEWIKKRRAAKKALAAGTSESADSNPEISNCEKDDEGNEKDDDALSQDSMGRELHFDFPPIVVTRNEII
ncbi:hypothetical protein HDU97_006801 [Phlyctochytrium planicorne]|nr:hypothetical protein HDU97_006801 [Phlyctochytrium planicorne]